MAAAAPACAPGQAAPAAPAAQPPANVVVTLEPQALAAAAGRSTLWALLAALAPAGRLPLAVLHITPVEAVGLPPELAALRSRDGAAGAGSSSWWAAAPLRLGPELVAAAEALIASGALHPAHGVAEASTAAAAATAADNELKDTATLCDDLPAVVMQVRGCGCV